MEHVNLRDASIEPAGDEECGLCEAESMVLYDDDKVCANCGHAPVGGKPSLIRKTGSDAWNDWHEHRRNEDEYEGWYGENRIKFVGGFVSAYDY